MLKELNRQINNLFSVTNAVINLSARHAALVDEFSSSTLLHLNALLDTHNLGVANLIERKTDLRTIVETTLKPWRTDPPRTFIDDQARSLYASEGTQ